MMSLSTYKVQGLAGEDESKCKRTHAGKRQKWYWQAKPSEQYHLVKLRLDHLYIFFQKMATLNLEVLATPNQMANPNNTDGWLASKPNSLTWSSQRHDFPWESKRRWVESRGGSNSRVKVGVEELIADPFVCLRQLQQVSQPHPNGMRHALVWSTWHGIATWRLHNNHHSWTAKDLPLHWQHSGSLLLVKQSTPTTRTKKL